LENFLHKGDEAQSVSYCFGCKGFTFFDKVNSSAAKKIINSCFIVSECQCGLHRDITSRITLSESYEAKGELRVEIQTWVKQICKRENVASLR